MEMRLRGTNLPTGQISLVGQGQRHTDVCSHQSKAPNPLCVFMWIVSLVHSHTEALHSVPGLFKGKAE